MTPEEFYEDPAFELGNFFKFENDGDEIAGIIREVTIKAFEATETRAASTAPVYHLERKAGTQLIEVTASNQDMKKQLLTLKPWIGDWVKIRRNRKVGNMVLFDITVKQAPAAAPTLEPAPAADDDAPPF